MGYQKEVHFFDKQTTLGLVSYAYKFATVDGKDAVGHLGIDGTRAKVSGSSGAGSVLLRLPVTSSRLLVSPARVETL